jgi:hypothetical protein
MMSHDLPNLNFPLTGNGPLSVAVQALGLENFADVADFIRLLPYGRVADGDDPAAVLRAHTGTCSSKHRFLAALAHECGRLDVLLTVGLYEMSERNTPGIGSILAAAGVDVIPEAHCYLIYKGRRYDFTGLAAGQSSPFDSLMDERSVAPDDLPAVKLKYHQEAIARWAAQVGFDFERAWQLREECIASLANKLTCPDLAAQSSSKGP